MINRVDISSDYIIEEQIISDLYRFNNFTLTVNTVNDVPDMLQSPECFAIVEDSVAATVVFYKINDDMFIQYLNYYRIFLILNINLVQLHYSQ